MFSRRGLLGLLGGLVAGIPGLKSLAASKPLDLNTPLLHPLAVPMKVTAKPLGNPCWNNTGEGVPTVEFIGRNFICPRTRQKAAVTYVDKVKCAVGCKTDHTRYIKRENCPWCGDLLYPESVRVLDKVADDLMKIHGLDVREEVANALGTQLHRAYFLEILNRAAAKELVI